MRRLLADRDARWLLAGQSLSMFGDRAMFLVLGIWVKALTGSNAAAGMVFLVIVAPSLAAPLSGLLVDRLRRRPLMIVTDLAIGFAILGLLFVRGPHQVWLIYLAAALYGAATTVLDSAQSALLTVMLPTDRLAEANGTFQTVREGLRLISPLAGAGLFAALGGGSVAAIDAVTFGASAFCLWRLRVEEPPVPRSGHRFLVEVAAGARHVLGTVTPRRIVLTTAAALLVVGFAETIIFAVIDQGLHRPPSFFGVLEFAQGIGAIAGGLTAARASGDSGMLAWWAWASACSPWGTRR